MFRISGVWFMVYNNLVNDFIKHSNKSDETLFKML